jgi:hypothetical protein
MSGCVLGKQIWRIDQNIKQENGVESILGKFLKGRGKVNLMRGKNLAEDF